MVEVEGKGEGRLYVFEGPDGAGKTTLARRVVSHFEAQGQDCVGLSFPGSEAGTLGALVYSLHHNPERFGLVHWNQTSMQLLHVAAHIEAIERRILPALRAGRTIVLDRFWWSTWVYGKASGMPEETLSTMIDLERLCWGSTLPDALFVIGGSGPKRDEEDQDAWSTHLQLYRELAAVEHERYPVHEVSNNTSIEETLADVLSHIG
jgi:dTMP kinase